MARIDQRLSLDLRRVLRLRAPAFKEQRGEQCLLVWAELARWMVVDNELCALLELFDGRHTLKQVLRRQAWQTGKDPLEVQREALPIVAGLIAKEVLGRGVPAAGAAADVMAEEPVLIANVTVNLTNRCNLRCRWCYNEVRAGAELPVPVLMDSIAAGRDVLAPDASFIVLGGEPTLERERLLAALDRAEGLFGPAAMVSTNGTLLDDDLVARLSGRRLEVQVSLDSADPERHDAIRGRGVFSRAVAGAERLVRAGVPTILSLVFDSRGAAELEPYLDLARSLGAREARFIPMRLIGRGNAHQERLPDLVVIFEALIEILERRPELRPLLARDYFSILATVCSQSSPRGSCGIGRKVVFIDADGSVYPCPNHCLPQFRCGELAAGDLAAIVRSSAVMREVRERYSVDHYPACRGCPFRHWCAGDCRGEALSAAGDPLAPSPHCEELKRLIPRMLWLMSDGSLPLGQRPLLAGGRRAETAHLG